MHLSSGLVIILATTLSLATAHAESPANMRISDQYTSLAINGIPDMVQGDDRKHIVNTWNKIFPQWVKHEEDVDGYVLDKGFYDSISTDEAYTNVNLSENNVVSESDGKVYFTRLTFDDKGGDHFIFKYMTVKKKYFFITTNTKVFPTEIHVTYKKPDGSTGQIDLNYRYSKDLIVPMLLIKPNHADNFYAMFANYTKNQTEFLPFPATMMLPDD